MVVKDGGRFSALWSNCVGSAPVPGHIELRSACCRFVIACPTTVSSNIILRAGLVACRNKAQASLRTPKRFARDRALDRRASVWSAAACCRFVSGSSKNAQHSTRNAQQCKALSGSPEMRRRRQGTRVAEHVTGEGRIISVNFVSVPVLPRREKSLTGHPARAAPKQDEAEQNQARNRRGLCWFGNDGEGNGVQVVNRRQRGDDVTRAKTKVGDDQTLGGLPRGGDPVVATIERVEIAVVGHRSKVVKIRCGTVGWVDRVNQAIAIDKEEVIVCIKSQSQSQVLRSLSPSKVARPVTGSMIARLSTPGSTQPYN